MTGKTNKIFHLRMWNSPMQKHLGIQAILGAIEENGMTIERINDIDPAINHFATNEARPTVIATDSMLLGPGRAKVTLRSEASKYFRKGGTLIVIWPFDVKAEDVDHFFGILEIPWKAASEYYRANFSINSGSRFTYFDIGAQLGDYEMQGGLLNNVLNRDCLYIRAGGGVAASMYADDPEVEQDAVAVAFTKIQDGKLGYVGDEEEEETVDVVLAMLGLM